MLTTRRLFTAILFLALFVMATREIGDPDFWWHLSAGKYIIETQAIPHVDVFSYTKAGQTWVTHEWLSEVLIYALYRLGSFPLLILVFAALITFTFGLVYAHSFGKPYLAAFAVLLAALATAPIWGVRPQILSMLLASVFLWVLGRATNSHANPLARKAGELWVLPPLMLLWVNLHSGYALGIVIVGVYLFGEIISRITRHTSRWLQLASIFGLCLIAVLFNPNGATMFVYPFETLTSPTMQAYIQEWFSPDFHQIEFQPFAGLLLATLAAVAWAGKRTSLVQTILLIGLAYAGLRSARNIPFFALVAAPVLAEGLTKIFQANGWLKLLDETNKRMPRGMAIVNWGLLALMALAGIARVAMVVSNQSTIERAKFPAAAVDFLQAQKIDGALYNAYDWGGYLMWRLYPQTRVFIDGRADVYGDAFIENVYLKAYRGGADWREPLERYNVRVVLIEPTAPIVAQLSRDAAWQKVYEDKQAVVYSK